ncbi:AraC family transcriptional regulator [Levilactobacillus yiduensis]|uniref:AraC family transcriptional regulator n=1 Tax=Levilactobacillus yiduensis TaxID=2953880 RepID=UPI000EF2D2B6|nr:AraC family transcriptional regulator [Levilactobacillus yiduensis]AYM01753.1 AraC family transcriptional regulator [Levilactobacillus brevis]
MDFLKNAKRLPVLDWNLTFFGAHEQQVTDDWAVPIEKHYAFECIYVLAGTEFLDIYGKTYDLKPGDFALIPPEVLHRVWAGHALTYFCFHFDLDDPTLKAQLIEGLAYHYPKNSHFTGLLTPHLNKIDSLISDKSYDFDTKMIIQIELSKMLQIFFQDTKKSRRNSETSTTEYARIMADYLKDQLTSQVLNYFKNGYMAEGTLVEVSQAIRKVGFSDGYGFRIFKNTYGISPREYLSKLKINEAKKLLTKPQYTINEIGNALGYKNVANFSRQFKRWTQTTPSEVRKNGRRLKW